MDKWSKGSLLAAAVTLAALPAFAQMSLPGKFEVTDTGSASYTIPISVVSGTAGLEPKLSLQYDSRSGNGLLGMGWSLAGLPAITRCSRTIAQDGAVGGVAFDANDRFCLDGQRLIAISGIYGADQTEYRTERESFSKIVSYGAAGAGPSWFKVWTKAGLVMEFGNTADSRIEAQGQASARVWAINKTSDTKGNWFSVSYTEDNANGEYRPARIDYTGNGATAPANSVRFVYETRPDIVPLYQAGSLIKTTQRMSKVQAWQGETLVREYRLSYGASPVSLRSRLTTLLLCTGNGDCNTAESTISWRNAEPGLNSSVDIGAVGWPSAYNIYPGDFTGDGMAGVFLAAESQSYSCSSPAITGYTCSPIGAVTWKTTYNIYPGDYNGDGINDLLLVGENQSLVCIGPNFNGSACTPIGAVGWKSTFSVVPGDYNGDGITDLFLVGENQSYLCTGPGFFNGATCPLVPAAVAWKSTYNVSSGDYNGDGLSDLLLVGENQSFVCLGPSFSGTTCASIGAAGWKSTYSVVSGDYNGDGNSDLVLIGENQSYFCAGPGFFNGTTCASIGAIGWKSTYNVLPGDYNGDGVADLFLVGESQSYFCPGPGFYSGATCASISAVGWKSTYGHNIYPADYDGDGVTDLLTISNIKGYVVRGWNGASDIISAVSQGAGATTTISYSALSSTFSPYTKDAGGNTCTYPCVDFRGPLYVVSEVKSSNGLGGEYRSTYRYAGAKADSHGRGFLGFRQMTVRDEQTGVEQVTAYRQDYPFTGLVGSREKKLAAQLLNRSTNTYSATDLGGTRWYPFLTSSLEESWELSGAALPAVTTSYQYDAYGNATQVGVSTGDGHSKATSNAYSNDATNWLLGRLIRSEVTSTTPGN